MRSIRKFLSGAVPIIGMAVVFGAVLFIDPERQQLQIIAVIVGVILIEAGVWKVTNPFLPSERRYTDLREEVDRFLDHVRELNEAAAASRKGESPEARARYDRALATLHRSVDRMGEVAGRARSDEDEEDLF